MTEPQFGLQFAESLVARAQAAIDTEEKFGPGGGPFMAFTSVTDGAGAGFLRIWATPADRLLDRLVHVRLLSAPVDTHLFFIFGRAGSCMPHFHGQVVQFGPDACVYNADIMPRLDPVDHPGYFREVFGPVTRDYWKAATNPKNVCSMAPANPAIAAYLSPWSIAAGRPTNREELDRVTPSIFAYLDQCLRLARELNYAGPAAADLRERDRRHMEIFQSDELDPRAWKGVYRILGEDVGRRMKEVLRTPLQ
jgi:hypothetical protein